MQHDLSTLEPGKPSPARLGQSNPAGVRSCRCGRGPVGDLAGWSSSRCTPTPADIELDEALILITADEAGHGENARLGLMFRAASGGSLAV